MLISKKVIVFTKDYFYSFLFHKLINKKIIEIFPFIESEPKKIIINNGNTNNIIRIGFLGRLSEEKGLEHLIQASILMKKNNTNHLIFIAGDLEDSRFKKNINKLLKISKKNKEIIFLGKLSDEKKNDFYNSIDVLVLPSLNSFEAFGLVQLEAMSHGKPVIVSDLRGVRIPIQYTGNGLLFRRGDVKELVKCIEYYYQNLKEIDNKHIQNSYIKYFNQENFKKLFLSIFI